MIEDAFADADGLRGYFDQLVVFDPFEALFERHDLWRRELDGHVGATGSHVRQMLFAANLDDHVGVAGVLADDLADAARSQNTERRVDEAGVRPSFRCRQTWERLTQRIPLRYTSCVVNLDPST